MPKGLVIGCGYVGLAVALDWKARGDHVYVTTTSPGREKLLCSKGLEVIVGADLKDPPLSKACQAASHLLVSVAPNTRYPAYETVYLKTAENLVEILRTCTHPKQIIYTGSASVYGDQAGDWVDEELPLEAKQPRTQTLLETENCLLSLQERGHRVCIFRLGEIYGPDRQIAKRLKNGGTFPGDGTNITNLIHLDDIVRATSFACDHQLSGIYNLANDTHLSRKEFYQKICEEQDLPPVQWDPNIPNHHGGQRRLSTKKLRAQGFRFSHPHYNFSE